MSVKGCIWFTIVFMLGICSYKIVSAFSSQIEENLLQTLIFVAVYHQNCVDDKIFIYGRNILNKLLFVSFKQTM